MVFLFEEWLNKFSCFKQIKHNNINIFSFFSLFIKNKSYLIKGFVIGSMLCFSNWWMKSMTKLFFVWPLCLFGISIEFMGLSRTHMNKNGTWVKESLALCWWLRSFRVVFTLIFQLTPFPSIFTEYDKVSGKNKGQN